MKKEIIYFNTKLLQKALKIGIVCAFISLVACGGGGDDTPDPIVEAASPDATTLIFPEANSECIEGSNITATESTITFKWNASKNTDSYGLQLKDLETGSSTSFSTKETSYAIKLNRGTPYSWSVTSQSKNTSKTATSAVWKFYNAGAGNSSYAPFPAEVVSPEIGATVASGTVDLDWTGNDIDGDIDNYDVYFGETNASEIYKTAITESSINAIPVVASKTYYWKVVTKDNLGNTSTSDVFSFKVE